MLHVAKFVKKRRFLSNKTTGLHHVSLTKLTFFYFEHDPERRPGDRERHKQVILCLFFSCSWIQIDKQQAYTKERKKMDWNKKEKKGIEMELGNRKWDLIRRRGKY